MQYLQKIGYIGSTQVISIFIKEIIFVGRKGTIIDKGYLCNRHNRFADHDAFAFGIVDDKGATASKEFEADIPSSFVTVVIHGTKRTANGRSYIL